MSDLVKITQGIFTIDKSFTLQNITDGNYKLLTVDDIFSYKHYELNKEEYFKVSNGNYLSIKECDEYLILTYQNKNIAIYKKDDNLYKSWFRLE